jgi:hypothetical protein
MPAPRCSEPALGFVPMDWHERLALPLTAAGLPRHRPGLLAGRLVGRERLPRPCAKNGGRLLGVHRVNPGYRYVDSPAARPGSRRQARGHAWHLHDADRDSRRCQRRSRLPIQDPLSRAESPRGCYAERERGMAVSDGAAWLMAGERIAGAAGLGAAVIGWGVSLAFDWFTRPPKRTKFRQPFSVGRELTGLACGTAGSVAACWLGFARLGLGARTHSSGSNGAAVPGHLAASATRGFVLN